MSAESPFGLAALAVAGLVSGWLNVVAGGGSFLTLSLLIFFGVPPGVANGTNRIGILLQNVTAVWGFHRHRSLDWRLGLWAAGPAALGAALGTLLALRLGDDAFRRLLALLMVGMALVTLLGRAPARGPDAGPEARAPRLPFALGFFGVGLYGGFVQAGVGFLILAATTLAGLDLVRANAIKVLCVLIFTPLSLAIFVGAGRVDWIPGLALGAGALVGGALGVRFTVSRGERAVRAVVNAALIVFALKLWFD